MQSMHTHAPRSHQAPSSAPSAGGPSLVPNFAGFSSDPMAVMGAQLVAQGGMAYGEKLIEGSNARATSMLSNLRTYFAVNNQYVLKKLGVRPLCRTSRPHHPPLLSGATDTFSLPT